MSTDNTAPGRRARTIVLSATVLAVVGGLSLINMANGAAEPATVLTEPPTVIATSCGGFGADAQKLFGKGGAVTLRGTFAPGDHVHLAIDLRGAGYSWNLAGALGERPNVTLSMWAFILFKTIKLHARTKTAFTPASASTPASTYTTSDGKVDGYGRWFVEFDVAEAGDGAITINQTGGASTPKVAIATCTPRKAASPTTS